jgi:hypothetical protein
MLGRLRGAQTAKQRDVDALKAFAEAATRVDAQRVAPGRLGVNACFVNLW